MSEKLRRIAESTAFQSVVTFVIVFAGVLVGLETDAAFVQRYEGVLHALDKLILGIFVLEIAVKMGAEGKTPWRYFRDPWNVFDFAIVAASFLPVGGQHLVVLRLVRLLRVLRLVHALPRLQILVSALIRSMPSMGYVSLFLGLLFYVYAVAGTFLFGSNDPLYFGSLSSSLLSLFRVVTLEGWTELLYIQMRGCDRIGYEEFAQLCTAPMAQPVAAVLYFTSFILLGTMIVLNLFIGVIMNGMTEATAEHEKLKGAAEARQRPGLTHELELLENKLADLHLQIARIRAAAIAEHTRSQERQGPTTQDEEAPPAGRLAG